MKVCAHFTVAPFETYHERFDSVAEALAELKRQGRYDSFYENEQPSVWVAKQCQDCSSMENYHESATIYKKGPRGGVKRVGYYP